MTATPSAEPRPAPPDLQIDDRLRMMGDIAVSRLSGSTPARLRLWSIATLVVLGLAAVANWWAATRLVDASDRAVDNTAPVLVATQDVFASIAEADAASAAVFLSGADEDREQRVLLEISRQLGGAHQTVVPRLGVGDRTREWRGRQR